MHQGGIESKGEKASCGRPWGACTSYSSTHRSRLAEGCKVCRLVAPQVLRSFDSESKGRVDTLEDTLISTLRAYTRGWNRVCDRPLNIKRERTVEAEPCVEGH